MITTKVSSTHHLQEPSPLWYCLHLFFLMITILYDNIIHEANTLCVLHKKRNKKQKLCFHKCCTLTHACTHHTDLTKEKKWGIKITFIMIHLGSLKLFCIRILLIISSHLSSSVKNWLAAGFYQIFNIKTKEMRMRAMYVTWLS